MDLAKSPKTIDTIKQPLPARVPIKIAMKEPGYSFREAATAE